MLNAIFQRGSKRIPIVRQLISDLRFAVHNYPLERTVETSPFVDDNSFRVCFSLIWGTKSSNTYPEVSFGCSLASLVRFFETTASTYPDGENLVDPLRDNKGSIYAKVVSGDGHKLY